MVAVRVRSNAHGGITRLLENWTVAVKLWSMRGEYIERSSLTKTRSEPLTE